MESKAGALVPRTPERGSALDRHFGDARAGLYGPHALLLQVMHPVVDAGVLEHSRFKTEPFGRLLGTVRSMATLVYGGPEGAAAESRRLRRLHATIRGVAKDGKRYHSLDPEAWTWVYATLVKGSIDSQVRFGGPLPERTIDDYYRQARELGLVLGVRPADLPDDWSGFEAYFARMIDTRLQATESARDVLTFLGELPRPFFVPRFVWRPLTAPVAWLVRLITIGTLPPKLRSELALRWSERNDAHLRAFTRLVRTIAFVTPQVVFTLGVRAVGFVNGQLVLRRERRESSPDRANHPTDAADGS